MSVCDYTNQPGFSLQERLLRDAYREIRELEEEIKKHPSREAVEILWMCTDGADGANIFAKLKKEIAQLLNSMYQDEKNPPEDLVQAEPGTDRERTEDVLADRRERSSKYEPPVGGQRRDYFGILHRGRGRLSKIRCWNRSTWLPGIRSRSRLRSAWRKDIQEA